MKKCVFGLLLLALFCCLLAGCQAEGTDLSTAQTENVQYTIPDEEYYVGIDPKLAELVAQTYLLKNETVNDWEGAELGECYPIYNPATEKVTYLEYKVKKNGEPKGYIMVNLKEDEPRIAEASADSGKTNFELLAEEAGHENIKAYRFSFASFAAEERGTRSGRGRIVAALGNIANELSLEENTRSGVSSVYEEWRENYCQEVEENGGYLNIRKKVYEENREWINKRNQVLRGSIPADKPPVSAQINWYSKNYPVLVADQFKKYHQGKEYWAGCVPTAGAIVLAYYAKMYNRRKLWPGGNPPAVEALEKSANQSDFHNFRTVTNALREYLGMPEGSNSSITSWLPGKLSYYSYSRGCGWIPYQEVYGGDSWTGYGFARLLRYLKSNSPAFLGYEESKKSGHAVVIYKAVVQRDWANNYKECSYYVFMGWGYREENWNATNWSAEKGRNVPVLGTKIITTWDYCIYDISMQSYTYLPD